MAPRETPGSSRRETPPLRVVPEPARAFTLREEAEVLRAAVRRWPRSAPHRLRLARLLNQIDAFEECIALFEPSDLDELDHGAALQAAYALFARDARGDSASAERICAHAARVAANDRDRALAMAEQAKALTRQGRPAPARDLLQGALRLDPQSPDAFKRLARPLLAAGEAEAALALTDDLLAKGVAHCRLLAVRAAALAQLGRIDAARELLGLEAFLYQGVLETPVGWDGLESFNAAIVDEVMANAGLRFGRYGTSSEASWRVDTPAAGEAPAVRALLASIAQTAERFAASIGGRDHPWVGARPARAVLRSWAVITEAAGYEALHLHASGWMSGGYYPQVPAVVSEGRGQAGCLAFATPEGKFRDATAQLGETVVRPRPGLLNFFPSHAYHRTYPHGADERRICIAFDIAPA